MYRAVPVIEVRIWGQRVGAVALDPRLAFYAFQYDPQFISTNIELSPLKMPSSRASQPFIFTDLPDLTFKRLPAMLSDALPDDFGNSLIDAWMAAHGVQRQNITPLDRLDYKQKATHDYSQLFLTIDQLHLDFQAKEQAFRRMAFNVLAANCDDHTKNSSFVLRQGSAWQLAPAYDITHAYNPQGEWTHQHLMSVNGKFTAITTDDLLAVGERFAIGTARKLLAQVRDAVANWTQYAITAKIPHDESQRIQQHHLLTE